MHQCAWIVLFVAMWNAKLCGFRVNEDDFTWLSEFVIQVGVNLRMAEAAALTTYIVLLYHHIKENQVMLVYLTRLLDNAVGCQKVPGGDSNSPGQFTILPPETIVPNPGVSRTLLPMPGTPLNSSRPQITVTQEDFEILEFALLPRKHFTHCILVRVETPEERPSREIVENIEQTGSWRDHITPVLACGGIAAGLFVSYRYFSRR